MTILEFISQLPCAAGAMVYALLAFYFTFCACVWLLEIPFKLMDWWWNDNP